MWILDLCYFFPTKSPYITMVKRTDEERDNEVFNALFDSLIEEEETKEALRVRGIFPICGWGQS